MPSCSIAAARKVSAAASNTLCRSCRRKCASFAVDVVLPVPFTPTIKSAFGLLGTFSIDFETAASTRKIWSRATLTTSLMPIRDQASRSCNVLMIRVVIGTPRSARMSASSSSSQSIGLFANVCASVSKKFMRWFVGRRSSPPSNWKGSQDGRPTTNLFRRVGRWFLHRFAQRTLQIVFHTIENPVNETSRIRATKSLGQLDRFVDRNDRRNVVAIKHFVNREPRNIAIDGGDAMELIILAVAPNALVHFRQVRDHSFDQRLGKFAHTRRARAKFPKVGDVLRSFAMLQIAPKMILNGGFTRPTTFTHKTYFARSFDMTPAIFTAARAASVPRLILFLRQRSRA